MAALLLKIAEENPAIEVTARLGTQTLYSVSGIFRPTRPDPPPRRIPPDPPRQCAG
jgi:hypothetical protein